VILALRICVVASYFYPRGYGGNAVYELCIELVKRGLEIHVVTSRIKGVPNFQLIHGIHVYRMPTYFLKLFSTEYPFSPTAFTDILKIAIKHSDLIHANFELFQTTLASGFVKSFLTKPSVLTMHGQGRNNSASYGSKMLNVGYSVNYNSLERIAVRSSDRIIALTNAVKNKALRLGAQPDKISIIPNGVNVERFRPFPLSESYYNKLGISKINKVITFVGRLHPTHGTELLMNAIPQVIRVHPNSIFVIAGSGPLDSYVSVFLKNNGLDRYVRVLGYREDVPELLNIADVVVYPALSVGMPLTVMEAMACGKSVVAFDVEGNREIIVDGKTGFLVQERSPSGLAEAMNRGLSNPDLLSDVGKNARAFVEPNYSWRKVSERVEEVYRKMLH
jgi:glycogen(starch) synthase